MLQELRKLLNHKHQLTDLLIQPIQRIMRYQLLLNQILRWELTRRAYSCTCWKKYGVLKMND